MIDTAFKNANILIVDDKEANIDILVELLELKGCTNVKTTTDSRLVVGLFKSFNPDLILLDLMMPHLSGYDILALLKELIPQRTYLPIMVLTANITDEAKQRALFAGATDFLSKPFDLIEVSLRIDNLLFARNLHQQLQNQNQILEEKVKERTVELETAYQDLEKANKDLKVLDQAKLDFLQLISHEIRTPLNGIKGFTYLLKSEIKSPELLNYLQYLEASAIRLERFSYQALMITELRTQDPEINIEKVPLHDLFNHSNILHKEIIQKKKINVLLQNDPTLKVITGDKEFLQICFDCLIDNAVKYSSPDDVVVIKVYSDEKFTVCEFIDNGPGFSPDVLNNLFSLFRLGDGHIDQNTGLNLALIKLIMNAHQGQIEVVNTQPKGATVRLTFNN
ncbi:MAG: hybrid sensor histidine kinase/response regulator [Bacteroidota bacterium]